MKWVSEGYKASIKIVDNLTEVDESFVKISAYAADSISKEASYIIGDNIVFPLYRYETAQLLLQLAFRSRREIGRASCRERV